MSDMGRRLLDRRDDRPLSERLAPAERQALLQVRQRYHGGSESSERQLWTPQEYARFRFTMYMIATGRIGRPGPRERQTDEEFECSAALDDDA